jgi:hypothetical protein
MKERKFSYCLDFAQEFGLRTKPEGVYFSLHSHMHYQKLLATIGFQTNVSPGAEFMSIQYNFDEVSGHNLESSTT